MTEPIDWMKAAHRQDTYWDGDEPVYSLAELRRLFDVRQLLPHGWLVLTRAEKIPGSSWLNFAVVEFATSQVGGEDTSVYVLFRGVYVLFRGEGPGGKDSLRECRHTYWGEDGYIFYPNGELIIEAFKAPAEFFDDMAEPAEERTA